MPAPALPNDKGGAGTAQWEAGVLAKRAIARPADALQHEIPR